MSGIPGINQQGRGVPKLVATQFRDVDPLDLDLHLLDVNRRAKGNTLDQFAIIPMRLPLPLMFRLLETSEGRTVCRNLPRIRFRPLPAGFSFRHELEVERLFVVRRGSELLHLRFALHDCTEVRYNAHCQTVAADDPGVEVFNSRFAWWL